MPCVEELEYILFLANTYVATLEALLFVFMRVQCIVTSKLYSSFQNDY